MKSLEEIQEMLIHELLPSLNEINSNLNLEYYNEILGDTSFLLAGFLELQLKNNFNDWETSKWIDDSLLTKVKLDKDKLLIWGVMIWGKEDVTDQWTDPFYFELTLNQSFTNFTHSVFLFCDLNNPEIIYEEFNQNRGIWDKKFYSNKEWNPSERNWRYIINFKNELTKSH